MARTRNAVKSLGPLGGIEQPISRIERDNIVFVTMEEQKGYLNRSHLGQGIVLCTQEGPMGKKG